MDEPLLMMVRHGAKGLSRVRLVGGGFPSIAESRVEVAASEVQINTRQATPFWDNKSWLVLRARWAFRGADGA